MVLKTRTVKEPKNGPVSIFPSSWPIIPIFTGHVLGSVLGLTSWTGWSNPVFKTVGKTRADQPPGHLGHGLKHPNGRKPQISVNKIFKRNAKYYTIIMFFFNITKIEENVELFIIL